MYCRIDRSHNMMKHVDILSTTARVVQPQGWCRIAFKEPIVIVGCWSGVIMNDEINRHKRGPNQTSDLASDIVIAAMNSIAQFID
jgi:hypothetical protein